MDFQEYQVYPTKVLYAGITDGQLPLACVDQLLTRGMARRYRSSYPDLAEACNGARLFCQLLPGVLYGAS